MNILKWLRDSANYQRIEREKNYAALPAFGSAVQCPACGCKKFWRLHVDGVIRPRCNDCNWYAPPEKTFEDSRRDAT